MTDMPREMLIANSELLTGGALGEGRMRKIQIYPAARRGIYDR